LYIYHKVNIHGFRRKRAALGRSFAVGMLLAWSTAGACETVCVSPSTDYRYLVASVADGTPLGEYRWIRNGVVIGVGRSNQTFLMRGGDPLTSVEGVAPLMASRVVIVEGRWGKAFYVEPGGQLAYPRENVLPLEEGAIEMWIATREDGESAAYRKDNVLLRYSAPNGEYLQIAQSGKDGTLYAGGSSRGQWQSAYGGRASMWSWRAGTWHHIAATYSSAENSMRFYVDGVKTADTNERHYWSPAANGERFTLGNAEYLIDEIRITSRALSEEEIRMSASRTAAPGHGEAWLEVSMLAPGDSVVFEQGERRSEAFLYQGVPISNPQPPSTLLPPGTSEIVLTVETPVPTACVWAVNQNPGYGEMNPFESEASGRVHRARVTGLSPDPNVVNEVFVRCASAPDYALRLIYRSLKRVNPQFPRIGNLWGSGNLLRKGHAYAARVDGYFGAEMSPEDIAKLRERNPEILILTSINTVENRGLPEDYYLHDTKGRRIEVWPGTYRLNLTKPYVAEYQARFAYQKMLDSNLMYDGCFFDNFFTSQSWLKADIHGVPVELDANEDGKPDDPAWLDREWRNGVFYELSLWRKLMPHALATGHLPRPVPPEVGEIFNGSGILFVSTNVIDGKESFSNLWDAYQRWWELGREPVITAIESSPPNQIAYGYGYNILAEVPAPTQEFARTFYRYMRFGLATALMNDGYFWHDFGDILHGIDWWYDEYDFKLGYPLGPAELALPSPASAVNGMANPSFEEPLSGTWALSVSGAAGAVAKVARDADAAEGQYSARIDILSAGEGVDWHVDFNQRDRALKKGVSYDLSFWAKADTPREIRLSSQKGAPDWRNYGLSKTVFIGTEWRRYQVTFEANETAIDSRIQFFLGAKTGTVWIDGVSLTESPPQVYRRLFTKGAVLLNGTAKRVTVPLPQGYRRFVGEQAPRYQYIVDDDSPSFRATGDWKETAFDTGLWKSRGPFYHHWGKGCHKLVAGEGAAEWELDIPEDGTYTIEAWWASPPEQGEWTRRAVFEVVADGKVIASASLDQTLPGDRWYKVAEVPLAAAAKPYVRVHREDGRTIIADALHVYSAARYNDGSPAREITLDAFDGILLKRD